MKCLTKVCQKEAVSRGLCSGCYQSANHLVQTKKATWDQIIEKGMAANVKVRRTSDFTKQFNSTP